MEMTIWIVEVEVRLARWVVKVDEQVEITRDGPTGEITRWVDWMG